MDRSWAIDVPSDVLDLALDLHGLKAFSECVARIDRRPDKRHPGCLRLIEKWADLIEFISLVPL